MLMVEERRSVFVGVNIRPFVEGGRRRNIAKAEGIRYNYHVYSEQWGFFAWIRYCISLADVRMISLPSSFTLKYVVVGSTHVLPPAPVIFLVCMHHLICFSILFQLTVSRYGCSVSVLRHKSHD